MASPRYQAASIVDANDNMWVIGGTYPANDQNKGKHFSIYVNGINGLAQSDHIYK
jgi:hypothetical protein